MSVMNRMTGLRTLLPLIALLVLAPAVLGQDAKNEGAEPTKKSDPTARFWEARKVMLGGNPKDAAELFRTVAREHPDADVADDCLYWMGRCYLRMNDREPDAVVAFKRIVTTLPKSPFVDDAARELMRLGDRTMVKVLLPRLQIQGVEAELAARALAELDEAKGVEWLEKREPALPAAKKARDAKVAEDENEPEEKRPESKSSELDELKAEIRRLRKELDESVKLLETLLAERAAEEKTKAEAGKKAETEKKGRTTENESEKKK